MSGTDSGPVENIPHGGTETYDPATGVTTISPATEPADGVGDNEALAQAVEEPDGPQGVAGSAYVAPVDDGTRPWHTSDNPMESFFQWVLAEFRKLEG